VSYSKSQCYLFLPFQSLRSCGPSPTKKWSANFAISVWRKVGLAEVFMSASFLFFTCEYCFSHYVTIIFLIITRYKLPFPDWRVYLIAGFSLVWIANVYMGLFARIRLDLKKSASRSKRKSQTSKTMVRKPFTRASTSTAYGTQKAGQACNPYAGAYGPT
jgi:hypothetical protein